MDLRAEQAPYKVFFYKCKVILKIDKVDKDNNYLIKSW